MNKQGNAQAIKKQIELAKQRQEGKVELAQEVVGIIEQTFSGPLPPPSALAEYNNVVPGAAERIIKMAEEQGDHRRSLEKKALDTDSRNSFCGVIFAFMLGMTAIIMGGIVALRGQTLSGAFFGGSGLAALVGAFIYGTRERRKEREAKYKPQ